MRFPRLWSPGGRGIISFLAAERDEPVLRFLAGGRAGDMVMDAWLIGDGDGVDVVVAACPGAFSDWPHVKLREAERLAREWVEV